MQRIPDDELIRHARALRRLARSLVSADDADDLAQDAAAAALASPPVTVQSWFGWLAGMLRHRARRLHRHEGRRRARERAVAPPEPGDDPAGTAVHREAIARLDAALLALPEPYQAVLILRYFEGLSPTAIAARTSTPLATVKSRLQRGLAVLRERLDAADGHDWRAGLGVAFGITPATGAGLLAAGAGGIAMGKSLSAAAVLAALLLSPWWWPTPAAGTPAAGVAPDVAHIAAAASGTPGGAPPPAPEQRAVVAVPAGPVAAPEVTYVGRCVDEHGTPLRDGDVRGTTRERDGGRARSRREQRVAPDGTFVVSLPIEPRTYHALGVLAAGRIPVDGQFHDEPEGARVDLGDVVLPRPHEVRGRVVDASGAPQARVVLELTAVERRGRLAPYPGSPYGATTAADGTFALATVAAGTFRLASPNRRFAERSPRTLVVDPDRGAPALELVVEPGQPPCRGVVVREDGSPIARAHVTLDRSQTDTDADGRFVIDPDPSATAPQRAVGVSADGFVGSSARWSAGDPTELRVVLRAQPMLAVRVVDVRTGQPVERYAAAVVPPRNWSSAVRAPMGSHPGGVCRIAVSPGEWWLRVRAADEALAPSAFVPLRVAADAPREVTVALVPWQQRRLVLTDGSQRLPDVRVELLDPGDATVRRDTHTFPFDDCPIGGPPLACILAAGLTDRDGALALRGPSGALALRLHGPGIALQVVQPIRLDEAGDLVVTATRGASWRGRLGPEEVVRAVVAGDPAREAKRDEAGLTLVDARGEALHRLLEPRVPVAADGTFVFDGIPPGRWCAVFERRAIAWITVDEGRVLTQDVDVSALAPADVRLRVRVDGAPARHAWVNVLGVHAADANGQPMRSGRMERADSDGVFALRTLVGRLAVIVTWEPEVGRGGALQAAVDVRAAGVQDIGVDLQTGALELEVLAPDGAPAADAELEVAPDGVFTGAGVHVVGADGVLRITPMAAGRYEVRVRPARLRAQAAKDEFGRTHGWAALEQQWLPAGAVDVLPGAAVRQQLRLPPAWAR
jgi:RNA polymerase sigma factor (sigma-70 family)